MLKSDFSFPHPVLGVADDMAGEFSVSLEVIRDKETRNIVFVDISISVENAYVKTLIEEDLAQIAFKIYCSSTLYSETIINPENSFSIGEDLLTGYTEIQAYIIAKNQIDDYDDESFHSRYEHEAFSLDPYDVIGLCGHVRINVDKTDEKLGIGNIFRFADSEKDFIDFNLTTDKIIIYYPLDENKKHPPNALFKTNPWSAFNIFIVPALTKAFESIKEHPDESEGLEWYQVLSNLLDDDQHELEPHVQAQLILSDEIPMLNAYKELTGK